MERLYVTFEGPRTSEDGVPVAGFVAALQGVQGAMRLMVQHLAGSQPVSGRPSRPLQDQGALRVSLIRQDSVVLELPLDPMPDGPGDADTYGPRAFDALANWDGSENSTLPAAVTGKLYGIPSKLPDEMRLWFGDSENPRRTEVKRINRARTLKSQAEEAILYGSLKAVNWHTRTAELHRYGAQHVPLRFDAELDDDMRRLATRHVEVRGDGRFDENDNWASVRVEKISGAPVGRPFDLDAFLNEPNPRVFDPEKVVTIDLTDEEWESFHRAINEGRDACLRQTPD